MLRDIMATPLSSSKTALWIVLVISTTVYAREWFGSNLQYKCHCNNNNNCGVNGDCADGCAKGWFGPQCQYVDLIYTENDGTTMTKFVDADDTTCNTETNHKQVVVTFERTFPFTWLRLVVNSEGLLLDSINVTFTDGSGNNNIPCTNERSTLIDSRTIDIYCDVYVEVKKVSVIGDAIGYLCSFYMSGGRNVALKQRATQSTTQDPGPEKAVDGNTNQQFTIGWSCSKTGQITSIIPVWIVTFLQIKAVNRYVIYNRGDCCKDRLLEFTLTSWNDNHAPVFSYQDSGPPALLIYTVTTATRTSPVKSVSITTSYTATATDAINPILTLCEVEIDGDSLCSVGKYGRECEYECHCASNEKCFASTGRCPNGCAVGYTGDTCDEICAQAYYGVNCLQRCSDKCVDRTCDINNGRCYECLPGFVGDFCDQPCPATKYGPGCSNDCSSNCRDVLCDAVSGVCTSCPSGKTGDLCDQNCPANKYGPRCINVCSTNCLNQLCDGNDGRCNQCPPGRQGAYCDQVCALGTYGDGCQERCNEDCDGCDPEDGKCSNGCISGYTGNMCDETCPYGKYGRGCLNDCSEFCNKNGTRQNESACHHVSGACLYACIQNYTGSKCDTKLAKESRADPSDSTPGLSVGLGIGLGVAALVVIVVVVIYCYRRRLSAQKSRRQRPPGYDPAEPTTDEHGYNELFKSDDGYNLPTDEASSAVTVKSPSKKPAQATVQYVNAEATVYEDIDSVAGRLNEEKQSKTGQDNEGYANL